MEVFNEFPLLRNAIIVIFLMLILVVAYYAFRPTVRPKLPDRRFEPKANSGQNNLVVQRPPDTKTGRVIYLGKIDNGVKDKKQ